MSTMPDILSELLKYMQNSEPVRNTVLGVAKGAGYTVAGTALGGLLLGPLGALVGGVVGALFGYHWSRDYDNLIRSFMSMPDTSKQELKAQIKRLLEHLLRLVLRKLFESEKIQSLLESLVRFIIQKLYEQEKSEIRSLLLQLLQPSFHIN